MRISPSIASGTGNFLSIIFTSYLVVDSASAVLLLGTSLLAWLVKPALPAHVGRTQCGRWEHLLGVFVCGFYGFRNVENALPRGLFGVHGKQTAVNGFVSEPGNQAVS